MSIFFPKASYIHVYKVVSGHGYLKVLKRIQEYSIPGV